MDAKLKNIKSITILELVMVVILIIATYVLYDNGSWKKCLLGLYFIFMLPVTKIVGKIDKKSYKMIIVGGSIIVYLALAIWIFWG